uniref:Integrase catalytic domain-containing protein n=1 Tax=Vitis vinifera TaxID=29760 RepID=A5BAP3_VITVI|nr:hypothetical protein VITISV_012223 [Vitis vinifera]
MPGIHPLISSHRLNILPSSRPILQKVRQFHLDRQRIMQDEVDKLLVAGFIREVEYPDWLANVVVVPKKRREMANQIVDFTAGHKMLSFLDGFSRYHQIPMYPLDEEKTVFITPHKLYCYKIFKPLIGHMMKVYIDDIVDKSRTRSEHDQHLEVVFHLLREYGMKLNLSKCVFEVSVGKFLGFMVTQRGIEVNPDQIKVVMETSAPSSKKELQRLTGRLVALGRFIQKWMVDSTRRWSLPNLEIQSRPPLTIANWGAVGTGYPARLEIYNDSQLVVGNIQGEYETRDGRMTQYLTKVRDTLNQLNEWAIKRIPRIEKSHLSATPGKKTQSGRMKLRTTSRQENYPKRASMHIKFECKRSFGGPYLRYLDSMEAQYVLAELYEGICGNHTGGQSLQDAEDYVKKCDRCQRHAPIPCMPSEVLNPNKEPLAIRAFDSTAFRTFCSELKIKNLYSTPRYPQSNGQAEVINKTMFSVLKKRLEKAKGKWVEESPGVPHLNWADKVRENTAIRMASYQQRVVAHYNWKVQPCTFKVGTLVLKKVFENTVEKGARKF